MRYIYVALLFILSATAINAQNPILSWAHGMGSLSSEDGYSLTLDDSGSVFTTGSFKGTMDFDPGPDTFNLSPPGATGIFVSKLDASGDFKWAVSMGSSSSASRGECIAIDPFGNVYVTGMFMGTADLDPGPATYNLTSAGGSDAYVVKLDVFGNFIWAVSFGTTSSEIGYGITVDNLGNVFTCGTFSNTVDFDPGLATSYITSNGSVDVFIQKLDPAGNLIWAKALGGAQSDFGSSIQVDNSGNVYTTGYFQGNADFNPSGSTNNLSSNGSRDVFISKLNSSGNFVWARAMGGAFSDEANFIKLDNLGNVYITGKYVGTADFDPGVGIFNITSLGGYDIFACKYDNSGALLWAGSMGGVSGDVGASIALDASGNIYSIATFSGLADFDPGPGTVNLTASGSSAMAISKMDSAGNFQWAVEMGGDFPVPHAADIDALGNIFITGTFSGSCDFDPGPGIFNISSLGNDDFFIIKLQQKGVTGTVFNDLDSNCVQDSTEIGLVERRLIINPGNIVVETNSTGRWILDSLPVDTYSITVDTSGGWSKTCPSSQIFAVTDPNELTIVPSIGLLANAPCSSPMVSIFAPALRPCFTNQRIYVKVCNQNIASGILDSAYVDVHVDSTLTVDSATLAYIDLGNNIFRFDLGNINPGVCFDFSIMCSLSCNAILGQSLCMQALLYPVDTCTLDTVPYTVPTGVSTCTSPWDKSSLTVNASCVNDSVRFVVYNTGDFGAGNMTCYSAIRLYIDGQFILLDSVLLVGGDSAVFQFSGDGRTWRLEADQHPLHPGNSHPNASIELCGNNNNWTPDLINMLPMNDADPVTDIFCGLVTGSYDPNDKTGYPYGVGDSSYITVNQSLQYLVRFQNTGTDTAFKVVITDTLSDKFNIFSVASGASNHNYTFRIYGPRVLEWTFENILLPDSNVNESESHGFISFSVDQIDNLSSGSLIENEAAIYFDYNSPIITTKASHIVNDGFLLPQLTTQASVSDTSCSSLTFNGYTYNSTGIYMQNLPGSGGADSIITYNLTINNTFASLNPVACQNYIVPSGDETYTVSGIYMDTIPNGSGCDSILTINLSVNTNTGDSINVVACQDYTVPSGDETYTVSGIYSDTLLNSAGCDSIIAINLTINGASASTINPEPCLSYTVPSGDETYAVSGVYTDTISNAVGCDSILTINLTLANTSANLSAVWCESYTVPSGDETYTVSGTYTDTISNVSGCDSIITIALTITSSTSSVVNESSCISYMVPSNDETYTSSGTYMDTIPNAEGCDSVLTINLTINGLPSVSFVGLDSAYCTYAWAVSLNASPVGGIFFGTGVGGNMFDLTLAGLGSHLISYAYVDNNGCSDTVSQSVSVIICPRIEEGFQDFTLNVFPNPNSGIFTIVLASVNQEVIVLTITDNIGKEIYTEQIKSVKNGLEKEIDLGEYPSGVYNLQLLTENGIVNRQIIIE